MHDFDVDQNFNFFDGVDELETTRTVDNQILIRNDIRLKCINGLKKEALSDLITCKPEKDQSIHIVSNGTFDFFTIVPVMLEFIHHIDQFYGSTWTMSRSNVQTLLSLFDDRQIDDISIITGLYFKRRESAVYSILLNGLMERQQRYKCFKNHSKIILMSNRALDDYIVIEGSANFTANPRAEQYTINNSKELFDFHKHWMDEYLNA